MDRKLEKKIWEVFSTFILWDLIAKLKDESLNIFLLFMEVTKNRNLSILT